MPQVFSDVCLHIEKYSDEFSFHGSIDEISRDLQISQKKVLDSIQLMENKGDAQVFWFEGGHFILRLLPFSDFSSS